MFGLDKIKDLKKNAEAAKQRLETITVEGVAGSNLVKVVSTASKRIVSVDISDSVLRTALKEDVDKLVLEAINDALHQAENVATAEMKDILPNIPGLGL